MPELRGVLAVPIFLYGAAASGLLVAFTLRAWTKAGRPESGTAVAVWCAAIPPIAVVILAVMCVLHPHVATPGDSVHSAWHQLESRIHMSPLGHGLLHVANLLVLVVGAGRLIRAGCLLVQARAFASALRAAARPTGERVEGRPVMELALDRPTCFTLGGIRPSIYVSTGLQQALSPRDREAMLAHEAAHVRRRDGLLGTLLSTFYALFPLPGGATLYREWRGAAERLCDAEAARRLGNPYDVAAALVRVARMGVPAAVVPHGQCFASGVPEIETRVAALVDPSPSRPASLGARALPMGLFAALAGAFVTVAHSWVHHLVDLFVHH